VYKILGSKFEAFFYEIHTIINIIHTYCYINV